MASEPQSFLPLKPVDYLVLTVLHDKPCHGYGMVLEIERRTEGQIQLVPGNLYAVIRRLVDQGLVRDVGRRPASAGEDRRRRYYEITRLGRRVAAAEARRMQQLVRLAAARNLLGESS